MSQFTAQDVQTLRQAAGVGMMDAKQALSDSDGDHDKAFDLLRERGLAAAAKRSGREANEGAVGSYVHLQADRPVMGVLVELASETDFVAKSDEFRNAANDIAMHVGWGNPRWVQREDVDDQALEKEGELIARQAEVDGKPADVIPKIVEGKLDAFYRENVLYDQPFVNSEKFDGTVGEMVQKLAAKMGENIAVRRVARIAVGEEN